MAENRHQGCLLGLAVGDAMGFTVDDKSWEEICADYGPHGLLGYDLVNGCADVTGYTQLAAFVSNGLLLSISRGKTDYLRYITLSLREWARNQLYYRDPEKSSCWIAKPSQLRRHNNRDARMLDALRAQTLGTPDAPLNKNAGPGALTTAVAVALFYHPKRAMDPSQIGTLAAQTVALTHGDPEAILSGSVLAYTVAGILQEPETDLQEHLSRALDVTRTQFGSRFAQEADQLTSRLERALRLRREGLFTARQGMERLKCTSASEVLAGAVFAALSCPDDFDSAIITAVNHSGASAAVGAVTGALMGARLGFSALPDFYLESLGCAEILMELADDLTRGSLTLSLFNDDWDQKYVQGMPLKDYD